MHKDYQAREEVMVIQVNLDKMVLLDEMDFQDNLVNQVTQEKEVNLENLVLKGSQGKQDSLVMMDSLVFEDLRENLEQQDLTELLVQQEDLDNLVMMGVKEIKDSQVRLELLDSLAKMGKQVILVEMGSLGKEAK